jgi:hypothetical protein
VRHARLYEHLVKEVPPALRRAGLKPNHCVLASRLGVELLRHYGVRARAVATDLTVLNSPYSEAVIREESFDVKQAEEDGAWAIWVSRHDQGDLGHVVIVADERVLLDLTAHQANRPKKQIHAEAFWHESPEFARGERTVLRTDDDCVWIYEPRPDDRDFVRAPAWSAFRVSTRAGYVISERSGLVEPGFVAAEVKVPLL